MQILDQNDVYYNFINSLYSEYTKKYYKFCLEKSSVIKQYKNLMSASLKHACEISDIVLN